MLGVAALRYTAAPQLMTNIESDAMHRRVMTSSSGLCRRWSMAGR